MQEKNLIKNRNGIFCQEFLIFLWSLKSLNKKFYYSLFSLQELPFIEIWKQEESTSWILDHRNNILSVKMMQTKRCLRKSSPNPNPGSNHNFDEIKFCVSCYAQLLENQVHMLNLRKSNSVFPVLLNSYFKALLPWSPAFCMVRRCSDDTFRAVIHPFYLQQNSYRYWYWYWYCERKRRDVSFQMVPPWVGYSMWKFWVFRVLSLPRFHYFPCF